MVWLSKVLRKPFYQVQKAKHINVYTILIFYIFPQNLLFEHSKFRPSSLSQQITGNPISVLSSKQSIFITYYL